jgi:hypothetical protein
VRRGLNAIYDGRILAAEAVLMKAMPPWRRE